MAVTANTPILLNPYRPYSPGPFPRLSHKIASRRAIRSLVSSEKTVPGGDRMLVFVPPHPLIKHWISVMRNEQTPPAIFRSAMAELGRILIYEASRDWLPTVAGEVQSPMGVAAVEFIDPREHVTIIPILRAGLALSEHAPLVLPATRTYHLEFLYPKVISGFFLSTYKSKFGRHVWWDGRRAFGGVGGFRGFLCWMKGICRDEVTLQPSTYLNNLPDEFPAGTRIFVVDPMLATGGTIVAALDLLKERGVVNKQIRVISAVVAPPALQKLSEKFPGLHIYTGIIDAEVNEKGLIVPGLGDAGDRSFGT